MTGPDVVGAGSSGAKKVSGLVSFSPVIFYRVFNAQKRDKNKSRKSRFWIFLSIVL
jgi:hypothetical protein